MKVLPVVYSGANCKYYPDVSAIKLDCKPTTQSSKPCG